MTVRVASKSVSAPAAADRKCMVTAEDVGVQYAYGSKREDLQSRMFNLAFQRFRRPLRWVLQDVSFTAYSGEIIGVIGPNGAGKTTLCRTISGILRPDAGQMRTHAAVSALLSIGAGFNPELTGRENLLLNGMMLGLSRRQVVKLAPGIIAFAGLENFIDAPLKTYSSGMVSRLAFSIAMTAAPEILIIDEALSVGDIAFARKAEQKLQELVSKASLVMIVTHRLDFVAANCTRAIWLQDGRLAGDGPAAEIVGAYNQNLRKHPRNAGKPLVSLPRTEARIGRAVALSASNVGVFYPVRNRGKSAANSAAIANGTGKRFWPLKDITFEARAGEIVGIIGVNGAGKSTLCKTVAGILKPDTGALKVHGEVNALLSFGAGFNIQLTGRDNIFLNGMLMGMPKAKIIAAYDEIVAFSELEQYINEPLKRYSSGMKARLGFSIAAMLDPDIFIIDEALSVGDTAFHAKATVKMQSLIEKAKTVLIVTHNMDFVTQVCTRAMWISGGIIRADGMPADVVAEFRNSL